MSGQPVPHAFAPTARRGDVHPGLLFGVAFALAYEAVLLFTPVLAPYRFPIPYAVPIFDTPFALVAIGIGYLCLERHRLRQDAGSAAIGITLWLTALLALAHIFTQPDYPGTPSVNAGIAPYFFFSCFLAGLGGIGLAARYGDCALPLTDRARYWIGAAVVVLSLAIVSAVVRVRPVLPSLVMPPGRITPFALWAAGISNGLVGAWALWEGRKRYLEGARDPFASYLLFAALIWVAGLTGFLIHPYRYSIPWYLAGFARPFGVGVIFVGLLREQVWLYREARARQRDLEVKARHDEALQDFSQRLLEATGEETILRDAVRITHELFGTGCVGVFVFHPNTNALHLDAGAGWPPGTVGTATIAPSNESVVAYAFLHKEAIQVEDVSAEPRWLIPPHLASHGLQAGIVVPLGVREHPIGVLAAYYGAPHRFSDEESRTLTSLAHQTALALEKVRLYAELEMNLRRLNETQAQLIQADKLKALGTLLSGMAHELSNPLSTILLSVQLMKRQPVLPDTVRHRMDVVEKECERASRIIRELLVFAHRKPPERKRVDLNEVVQVALNLQTPEFDLSHIRVVRELSPVPPIWGDAHQLQQVLLNLFSNATQAMKAAHGHGVLTVRSREGGGGVALDVQDDGPGIAPENLNRVFDPFFTTKGVGEGTGLGLSLSIGIVEAHGGAISVQNVPGAGARFRLELPIGEGMGAIDEVAAAPARSTRRARILIVEDEAPLRAILTEILTGLGHHVDEAGTGRTALEHLERGTYEVVTLDLKLPDIDGKVIWQWMCEQSPELATCVIFITGDTISVESQKFLQDAGRPVLAKPLELKQIARVVDMILAARPP